MIKEIKYKSPSDKKKEDLNTHYKHKSENIDRSTEIGLVNDQTGSSVTIKQNGEVSLSASEIAQIRLQETKHYEVAQEYHAKNNRRIIDSDEYILNHHKLNPQLIELSDTRVLFSNPRDVIGNLMLDGTVLVKTWEPNLNKYVLMRRRIRTPMFSALLNQPMVPDELDTNVGYATAIDLDSAILMQKDKVEKDKITAQEHAAEGGQDYSQGDYNSYGDDFTFGSSSITNQGGMMVGEPEIINNNPNNLDMIWPVPDSSRITSPYGMRDGGHHNGIDIGGRVPQEKNKAVATADGVVTAIHRGAKDYVDTHDRKGWTGYGNIIEIKHTNGYQTLYAHLDQVSVNEGDNVKQGQVIGIIGTTGRSSGVHLHFTIWGQGVNKSKGYNPVNIVKPQN